MDGRPHGIQMPSTGVDLKTHRTLCWQDNDQRSAFFVPCGTFPVAQNSKLRTDFFREMGPLQAFVDCREVIEGYALGCFLMISGIKFVLIR